MRAQAKAPDLGAITLREFASALMPAETINLVDPELAQPCTVISTPWAPTGQTEKVWAPQVYLTGVLYPPEIYLNWATCKAVEYVNRHGQTLTGPRASNAAFHLQHFLMLDDIGNPDKSPLALDDPRVTAATYVLETSAGNYQVGYKLDPPLGPDENARLRAACHAAKLADIGALKTPHRWCRVPGSVNTKPGRNGWKAVLRLWQPDRVFHV